MAKHPSEAPTTGTLTLRLSDADRDLLDRLVQKSAAELATHGVDVTAASYVRGLIRRDAKAHELEPIVGHDTEPPIATAKNHKTATTKPPHDAKASRGPTGPTEKEVHSALLRALRAGAVAAQIGTAAKIDRGHLSRFKKKGSGLSAATLANLAAVPVIAKELGKGR